MPYSFKEKRKWMAALANPEAATADLKLLETTAMGKGELASFRRNPKRYAEEILYHLLDRKTAEEIRLFRRKEFSLGEKEIVQDKESGGELGLALDKSASQEEGKTHAAADELAEEAEARAEEAESELEEEKKKEAESPQESKSTKSTRE